MSNYNDPSLEDPARKTTFLPDTELETPKPPHSPLNGYSFTADTELPRQVVRIHLSQEDLSQFRRPNTEVPDMHSHTFQANPPESLQRVLFHTDGRDTPEEMIIGESPTETHIHGSKSSSLSLEPQDHNFSKYSPVKTINFHWPKNSSKDVIDDDNLHPHQMNSGNVIEEDTVMPSQRKMSDHNFSLDPPSTQRSVTIRWNANDESKDFKPESDITIDGKKPAVVVIYREPPEKIDEDEDDVSAAFIQEFNEHIGNSKNREKAARLLTKMRQLGGLEPTVGHQNLDIPSARMGLCLLATLNHHPLKLQALDSLYELLHNDNLTEATAIQLLSLVIKMMKNLDRELFQTEILDVQVKIARVYDAATEVIQRHYGCKHINAITKELKIQLTEAAKALGALNTLKDTQLSYHVNCSLEGVRRLKDDRKELFDLLERLSRIAVAIGSIPLNAPETFLNQLSAAFSGIDIHGANSWYDSILLLRQLGREALNDSNKLVALLVLIRDKHKGLNWRFSYAAMETLVEICMKAETSEIRKLAFEGTNQFGPFLPGLSALTISRDLPSYSDYSALTHLEKPRTKNPNVPLREAGVTFMLKLAHHAPDEYIKTQARRLLLGRLDLETDPAIHALLRNEVPIAHDAKQNWLRPRTPDPSRTKTPEPDG